MEKNKQMRSRSVFIVTKNVRVHGVCSLVSLWCLRVWSVQRLTSGGIPAPSAFSREKHAGAAVSPTANSLKWRSHANRIVIRKSKPHEHMQHMCMSGMDDLF